MFFQKFESLCRNKGKTPTGVGQEIGIPKTTISYWRKNDVIPKPNQLSKIATYFAVPVSELVDIESDDIYCVIQKCPICGMEYNAYDENSVFEHSEFHIRFTLAKKKFIFCYTKIEEEKMKARGRNVLNKACEHTDAEIYDAFFDIYHALFSRSLSASGYNLNHVYFEEYLSMLLCHKNQKRDVLSKLPVKMRQSLLSSFGERPGVIPEGQTCYNVPKDNTNKNVLRIAGRDGREIEKRLTDEQVKALEIIINQLPDAPVNL